MINNLKVKLLDCTLRDGGYYTNWDFNKDLVEVYLKSMNNLPIEYLEVGYRSDPQNSYLGEYFYLPTYLLKRLKKISNKKLVIILNEKDVRIEDLDRILAPCEGYIDMVRMAIDPANFERALELASGIKMMGFEVGFNVMYMSKWKDYPMLLNNLAKVNELASYFYMVDSYGGVYPEDVKEVYSLVSAQVNIPIGFHGHNNLELGLINTLTAIECGCQIVDATITGMGRGAGNLKMELLLTALNAKGQLSFDFNALSSVVDGFTELQEDYGWGTNLPYMVSGANSLPQKEVMDWVGKRYYSFNSIIRALHNQSLGLADNLKLPKFNTKKTFKTALIIGGGPSAVHHAEAIIALSKKEKDLVLIHASSKNALAYTNVENTQLFCLVGNEGLRMEQVLSGSLPKLASGVCPPYPRKMGTYIPQVLKDKSFELEEVKFSDKYIDSHTALALETAFELGINKVWITGYDGYGAEGLTAREQELFQENEYLFKQAASMGIECISLTSTAYNSLKSESVFAHL